MKYLAAFCLSGVQALTLQGGAASEGDGDSTLPHIQGYFPVVPDSNSMAIHKVAYWRQKPDAYIKNSYKNPKTGKVSFNSCMDKDVSAQDVCSSNGICAPFDKYNVHPVFYCQCYLRWAGIECSIPRKSQLIAWLLSLFLGIFGADQYYLQQYFWCGMKILGLFTGCMLSALGAPHIGVILVLSYWLYDIVYIGSAPCQAREAKVAADLPHWTFVCWTIVFFAFIAFVMGVSKVYWKVKEKRRMADNENFYSACDAYTGKAVDVPNVGGLPTKYFNRGVLPPMPARTEVQAHMAYGNR